MRRLALLVALIALCLAAAGCGSHHPAGAGPLDDAVGYFAKDAPFVAAITTDPNSAQIKQLESIAGRFPAAAILGPRLRNLAGIHVLRWSRDVRPQLGAPLVAGLVRPAAGKDIATALVLAMRIKHPLRAKQVLLRQPGFRGTSKSSGVRVYEDSADKRYAAVDGNVLVVAANRDILEQALAMRRSDNRMRASGFERDMAGLPAGDLAQVSADPKMLIGADPRLRPALGVAWLASLRRMGAVVRASDTGLSLDLRIASDPSSITDDDLPLAPTTARLPLIGRSGEVQAAVREPGRLARFAFAVLRAVAPQRMARFRALEPPGIDLEKQLPRHLAAVGVLAYDPASHALAARASLHDSNDVRDSLARLAPALPDMAAALGIKALGIATPAAGESFYALAKPSGKSAVFGVVGDSLVVASEARRAADLASEPTHTVGPKAAAVVTMNARQILGRLLAQRLRGPAGLFAPLAVESLRDLTGWLTISRSGLSGHFELTIVK